MKFIALLAILLHSLLSWGVDLKIEKNEVLASTLREMRTLGSSPEIYPFAEQYRLDLSLEDLVDQVAVIARDFPGLNERLKSSLGNTDAGLNFPAWLDELKSAAAENPELQDKLDKKLFMQFYTPAGVALLPEYKYIDLQKLKDNGRLARIKKYNIIAGDAEAQGLLAGLKRLEWKGFYTKSMTVAKLKSIRFKQLKKYHKAYYLALIKLYEKHDLGV